MIVKPGTTNYAVLLSVVKRITGEKPGGEAKGSQERHTLVLYAHAVIR